MENDGIVKGNNDAGGGSGRRRYYRRRKKSNSDKDSNPDGLNPVSTDKDFKSDSQKSKSAGKIQKSTQPDKTQKCADKTSKTTDKDLKTSDKGPKATDKTPKAADKTPKNADKGQKGAEKGQKSVGRGDERGGHQGRGQRGKSGGKQGRSPLISIVTITYNAEETVGATVKSVAQQTWHDYEHLIIDGASRDATIVQVRLNGRRNLRILSEPDEGLYDAMNKGLRMARGKYVIFLNAGDTFHSENTLQEYGRKILRNDPDIIYGDTVIVDKDRKYLRPRHLSVPSRLTTRSFLRGMLICHQAFMVRRSLAPFYDTKYRFSADYDWCIRCIGGSKPGKRVNLRQVTIDYLDDGLTEKNKIKSLNERFHVMREHYGLRAALWAHLSFLPRMIRRRFLR